MEDRTQFIGASEVATLLGLNPFQDAYTLYQSKIDPQPDKPSDARDFGNHFELPVLDWICQRTLKCEYTDYQKHIRHGRMGATLDAILLNGTYKRRAFDKAPIDVKTIGYDGPLPYHDEYGKGGTDQIPLSVFYQLQQQMFILDESGTKVRDGFLGLFDMAHPDKKKIRIYRTPYSRATGLILQDAINLFWNEHIEPRIPPDPDQTFLRIGF